MVTKPKAYSIVINSQATKKLISQIFKVASYLNLKVFDAWDAKIRKNNNNVLHYKHMGNELML